MTQGKITKLCEKLSFAGRWFKLNWTTKKTDLATGLLNSMRIGLIVQRLQQPRYL